ncbi:DUF4263 domain-containing protein [Shouchella clausii]|nr:MULTISPECIES: Shedu anti-phage system protein SduA domain-containing protein [Shouchella]ALA55071.1 hypothetical protein DB29_04243 [Shouchella clausii]MBU3231044.1 DUF4263 domain-containing protein [Shouchella clausii]MBU3262881.1 DUF4263 domain-containing protein [Shouchella clausii]MBU3505345.1 DUF4263 domain-containing protein [Shouchella clausii]MBX0310055.1 DUF4263 domain-containing protein [Shouchella clausii]
MFPNILLFTKTEEHFIFELIGAQEKYTGLTVKQHIAKNTNEYLYQFKEDPKQFAQGKPIVTFTGSCHGIVSGKLARRSDEKKFEERFGKIDKQGVRLVIDDKNDGPLISFAEDFLSCYLVDVMLINNQSEVYRVKDILSMMIVSHNYSKRNLTEELEYLLRFPVNYTNELFGIKYCESEDIEKLQLASQFANLFLIPGLRETSIGEFIKLNGSFLKSAFECSDFLYEKEFLWLEGNPDPLEKSINPDLLIKRSDGLYDICDLKTPKLDKKNLTQGGHKRRRFHDYIDEGLAQLANYDEYFTFSKNIDWAYKEYKVRMDNPLLYLIVGNYENLNSEHIREASRHLKDRYRIIDFDTLYSMYINKSLNK